ncbi:hypothetical protein CL689_03000 [Candidatus Saccharibacteria bacterium]|nr:hypothetical protein [Candidatus Saccharibacteria bacterium]|tara:strand:- start:2127 stop:3413 length:1287 start_codon:yes stop_codon:yes gene_type:complete
MTDNSDTKPKFHVFLDEAASYIGGNDNLKERLRAIQGVPNVIYEIRGDKVFVFDALVDLTIMASREKGEDLDDSEVLALIKQAELTPIEAVEKYGVCPTQFRPERLSSGGYRIVHRPLNAVLPGPYENHTDLNKALATLLMGRNIDGKGETEYRGQPLTLIDPLSLVKTEDVPAYGAFIQSNLKPYLNLGSVHHVAGFEPMSKELFDAASEQERAWAFSDLSAREVARGRLAKAWPSLKNRVVDTANTAYSQATHLTADEIEEVAALRRFYPELVDVHAYAVLQSISDYHSCELGIRSTGADGREEEFLFYLIGKATAGAEVKYSIAAHGERVSYFIIQGKTLSAAIENASRCTAYDKALSRLCSNLAKASRFLKEETEKNSKQGPRVSTISDIFREGREYNAGAFAIDLEAGEMKAGDQPGQEGHRS